jgi:tetratricopeptide (TPR) repeat protein
MTRALAALALLATTALADQKTDEAIAKAEEQFQKGKSDDALKTLQKCADQNQAGPDCRLALGRLQERLGNLEEAATAVAKAVELSASAAAPLKAQAYAALACLDLRRGSGRDAVTHAEEAVKAEANPLTLSALARAYARVENGAKALETAEKAIQAAAASGQAHQAKGTALLALHRNEDAAAEFRKALEDVKDPKLNNAHIGLAQALVAQGKAAEGVAEARKAVTDAQCGEPTRKPAVAETRCEEAQAVLAAALLAENPSNTAAWSDAIGQAQQGAFLNQRSAFVLAIVGKIFEGNGNTQQAEVNYRKAAEIDPGYAPALSGLIVIQVRKGDLDGALAAARKLVEQVPQSTEAQLQLGRVLLRKNEYAEAVNALEKATEGGASAEALALLGTAYQYTRRTADAVAAYKKATDLAPDNLDYKTTYGLLQGMSGDTPGAVALLNKVVASPNYKKADAYLNLGWVYRNAKPPRTEESVKAYQKALEIDPKSAQAALGMGWAYSFGRQWDQSIAAFRKAAELDPSLAGEANHGIAWCYFFKKEMGPAEEYLAKAQAAGRSDPRLKQDIDKIKALLASGKRAEDEMARAEAERRQQREKEQEGPDLANLVNASKSANAAVRRRAYLDMAAAGGPAVQYLTYGAGSDPDINVREAAVKSLSAMGCAAKAGLSQLRDIAAARPDVSIDATKEQMQLEVRQEDLRKQIRALLEKLQKC